MDNASAAVSVWTILQVLAMPIITIMVSYVGYISRKASADAAVHRERINSEMQSMNNKLEAVQQAVWTLQGRIYGVMGNK